MEDNKAPLTIKPSKNFPIPELKIQGKLANLTDQLNPYLLKLQAVIAGLRTKSPRLKIDFKNIPALLHPTITAIKTSHKRLSNNILLSIANKLENTAKNIREQCKPQG